MPRPRQRGSDTTAKWEAAYRRLRPELDYLASVASDAEFGRSGRLRSAKDLQNVSDAFKEICAAVSKMEYWPLYIWTEEPSAAVVTLFGATAARWAATGGGMVEKDDGVANATGTSSSITSSTIAVAWISVLSSYGELLGFLLKAWKASSDEDEEELLYNAAMDAIAHALHMDLIPALSVLLASPACAPAAGTTGFAARTAALEAAAGLCGLAFCDPTALGSFDMPPATHKHDLLLRRRQQGTGQPATGNLPESSFTAANGMNSINPSARAVPLVQRPVGATVLDAAASCALFEHACRAVRVAAGADGGGPGPAAAAGGGDDEGPKARKAAAEGLVAQHSLLAEVVSDLGRAGVLLKDDVLDDTGEEAVMGRARPGGGVDWAVRTIRRAVRQVLSGPCLQYFLGAHVACQLHAADGGTLYGLPGTAAAALPLLMGCSYKCACTEQVRSSGLLGAVRCWWMAYTTRTGPGPIRMLYDKPHVHTMCMRLAVAALASYYKDLAAGGSGSGARGGRDGRRRGKGAMVSRQGGDRQPGMGVAESGAGQRPWERFQLSRTLLSCFPVCLEAILTAAAALPVPPLRCREEVTHWDEDAEWQEQQQQQQQQVWVEQGAGERQTREGKAQRQEPEGGRVRRWWAVAVPATHVALDAGADRNAVPRVVLQQVLDLAAMPPLEPDLPTSPPPGVAPALEAGYLPCLERALRVNQSRADSHATAAALLSTVDSWGRTARLLAYGDVRQAAGLVATVGKLLRRLSLPFPGGRHGADEESEDEEGRSRPLWLPLGLPEEMLVWLAWPWKAEGTGRGGTGGGDGSETQEEGSPAASAPSLKLLDLVSLAVPRWLPHVAMLALAVDGRLVHASERAAWVTLLWVPPLTHAYARAVDTGDAAAAAAWRGLLLHDMSVLAVLERQLQGLMRSLVMEFRQPGVACKRRSCKWVTRRWEMELGFELADDGRALHGARLVRRGMVRGAGEDGEVEEFKDSCMYCCHALACALWAMHCVAAALPEEVGEHLKRTNGRLLRGLVTRVTGPEGVAPRPRLRELLDGLAGGGGGGSSSGTGSGSCGGSSSSGGGNGAVGGGFGAGGGSLAACVPDPRVWGGTRASMVAQQLLPPHTAGQQLGVRVCSNPRCDELGGDSEVDVPLPYVCVHCKGMWYCGRGCMVAHWRAGGHKEVCEAGRGRG